MKMQYDLSKVPAKELYSEIGRRRAARRRKGSLGRRKRIAPCRFCGTELGVVEMRRHVPRCPKRN